MEENIILKAAKMELHNPEKNTSNDEYMEDLRIPRKNPSQIQEIYGVKAPIKKKGSPNMGNNEYDKGYEVE